MKSVNKTILFLLLIVVAAKVLHAASTSKSIIHSKNVIQYSKSDSFLFRLDAIGSSGTPSRAQSLMKTLVTGHLYFKPIDNAHGADISRYVMEVDRVKVKQWIDGKKVSLQKQNRIKSGFESWSIAIPMDDKGSVDMSAYKKIMQKLSSDQRLLAMAVVPPIQAKSGSKDKAKAIVVFNKSGEGASDVWPEFAIYQGKVSLPMDMLQMKDNRGLGNNGVNKYMLSGADSIASYNQICYVTLGDRRSLVASVLRKNENITTNVINETRYTYVRITRDEERGSKDGGG